MTKIFKAAALALATVPAITLAVPAYAQAANVGVANLEGAIEGTNAYRTAMTQMQTTYKAQIDQARTRSTALDAELKPLVDAFNAAQRAPNPNRTALQTQYNTLQQRRQTADQELQRITQPVTLARAYVLEQFTNGGRLDAAVKAAMAAKRITLVVQPQAVLLAQPGADITADVTAELNKTVTSVQITPPAGWQPGQQQPGAAAPAAAAPRPATPQGR
jgi:Skp family chaperone for outer membrane proteins